MLMHEDLDIQSGNYITLYHRVDGYEDSVLFMDVDEWKE